VIFRRIRIEWIDFERRNEYRCYAHKKVKENVCSSWIIRRLVYLKKKLVPAIYLRSCQFDLRKTSNDLH